MEMTIDQANKIIAIKDAFERLTKNPDYQLVFTEGYFVEEAKRLPHALVSEPMLNEIDQTQIMDKIKAIGHLELFLMELRRRGLTTEAELQRHEEEQNAQDIETEIDDVTGEEVPVVKE